MPKCGLTLGSKRQTEWRHKGNAEQTGYGGGDDCLHNRHRGACGYRERDWSLVVSNV